MVWPLLPFNEIMAYLWTKNNLFALTCSETNVTVCQKQQEQVILILHLRHTSSLSPHITTCTKYPIGTMQCGKCSISSLSEICNKCVYNTIFVCNHRMYHNVVWFKVIFHFKHAHLSVAFTMKIYFKVSLNSDCKLCIIY